VEEKSTKFSSDAKVMWDGGDLGFMVGILLN